MTASIAGAHFRTIVWFVSFCGLCYLAGVETAPGTVFPFGAPLEPVFEDFRPVLVLAVLAAGSFFVLGQPRQRGGRERVLRGLLLAAWLCLTAGAVYYWLHDAGSEWRTRTFPMRPQIIALATTRIGLGVLLAGWPLIHPELEKGPRWSTLAQVAGIALLAWLMLTLSFRLMRPPGPDIAAVLTRELPVMAALVTAGVFGFSRLGRPKSGAAFAVLVVCMPFFLAGPLPPGHMNEPGANVMFHGAALGLALLWWAGLPLLRLQPWLNVHRMRPLASPQVFMLLVALAAAFLMAGLRADFGAGLVASMGLILVMQTAEALEKGEAALPPLPHVLAVTAAFMVFQTWLTVVLLGMPQLD